MDNDDGRLSVHPAAVTTSAFVSIWGEKNGWEASNVSVRLHGMHGQRGSSSGSTTTETEDIRALANVVRIIVIVPCQLYSK